MKGARRGLEGEIFTNDLQKYMITNKLTATFEFLQVDFQHIELFDFPSSKFRFIAFTRKEFSPEICVNIASGKSIILLYSYLFP